MKKRLISVTLIVTLLCTLGGLTYAVGEGDLQPQDSAVEFMPGTVPAQSTAVEGMIPPINALVLCMLEQGLDYNDTDDVFLWNSLYYMISLYGQCDLRAELTDESLILPSEVVQDYAAALFTNYNGLPQLPEALKDRVRYDSSTDCYYLERGDAGLSETRIEQVEHLVGGGLRVDGVLVALEDGSELSRFSAKLDANDSMFGFSVSDLTIA